MSTGTREPTASSVKDPNDKPTENADTKESVLQVDDSISVGTSREAKDRATTGNQPISHTTSPEKDANTEVSQGQDDSTHTSDIRSVKTSEKDFKPYLKVSLENKELLKKLKWNQDEITAWRSPHFKGNKLSQERLKKCSIELEQENGLENIRIAWEGSDDFRSYEPSIRPESSGETLDSRDISQPQCVFRGLLLNTKYTVALKSAGKKKDKEIHIVFHTGPEAPSDIRMEGNTIEWKKAGGAKTYMVKITYQRAASEEIKTDQNRVKLRDDAKRIGQQATVFVTAINESGLQKTQTEQNIFFGTQRHPQELYAELNQDDPCRSIDVYWSDPAQGKPDCYKLKIFTTDGKSHYDETSTTFTRHTFTRLMSNKRFYVEVTAIRGKDSNSVMSNAINTEFKQRNPSYITDFGKISDFETELLDARENVKCNVKWKLPELGAESNNYERLKITASAKQPANPEKPVPNNAESETAHSFTFGWGKKYIISVIVTYRDLDVLQDKNAVFEKTIVTDFEAPSNIKAEAGGNYVTISWRRASGARAYRVRVFQESNVCEDTKMTISSQQNSCKFKIGPQLSVGSDFKIEVTSTDFVGNEKTETLDKVFLGRDDVPKYARMSLNQKNPYRSVDIEWQRPKTDVSRYECTLCTANIIPVAERKMTSQTKANFDGLKQDEVYYAIIQSINADGQKGSLCHTRTCKTKYGKHKRSPQEITQFGCVRNLTTTFHKTQDGKVNCNIKWNNPSQGKLQDDYELTGFQMECREKSTEETVEPAKHFLVEKHNVYKYFVEIVPGKIYIICVSAIYKDRDSGSDFEAKFEDEISPDISSPDLKIESKSNSMRLHWGEVEGASEYNIRIENVRTGNTAFEKKTNDANMNIPIKDKLYHGQLCDFFLRAMSSSGKSASSKSVREVIGGKDLPHSLRLQNVPDFPRRLNVTWEVNERVRPNIKEVLLREEGNNKEVKALEVKEGVAEFRHLKSSTCYLAEIRVNTNQGTVARCTSHKVTTSKDPKGEDFHKRNQELPNKIWIEENEYGTKTWLKWESVDLGEAYKTVGYDINVAEVGGKILGFWDQEILSKKRVSRDATMYELPSLKANARYKATIQPRILQIDSEEETLLKGKVNEFCGTIKPPVLFDPKYHGNSVTFQWEEIAAADAYSLQIEDALSHDSILKEKKVPRKTELTIGMKGEFRVGRRCKVGLTAIGLRGKSTPIWKPWTIGGDEVPQNVTAARNCHNPRRCVDIRFNKPDGKKQPEKYLIRACPSDGREKTEETTETDFTFKNLRSSTLYRFEVIAFYKGLKSLASISTDIKTGQDRMSGHSTVGNTFDGCTQPSLSYKNTTVQINSSPRRGNAGMDGIVQNADFVIVNRSHADKDVGRLEWSPSSFSNNSENFLVETYIWEAWDEETNEKIHENCQIRPQENQQKYTTEEIVLKLGNSYKFHIKTQYENIDLDQPNITSLPKELIFHARPCMPGNVECDCDYDAEKLNVKWNSAAGADGYGIELYICGQSEPRRANTCKKQCTRFSWDLYKDVDFGDEFYVVVIANGRKNGHSVKSSTYTVGGYAAPRQARASTDPESPTTAVIVQWEPPTESPDSYVVQAVLTDSRNNERHGEYNFDDEERNGRIKGLQPGTRYTFIVFAVHQGKKSPGCKTNAVTTCAGPGKAEITEAITCDKATAIYVSWTLLDRCKEYKLVAADEENDMIRIFYTESTNYTISGLSPKTRYKITVTGGTGEKKGFGNASDPVLVNTDKGLSARVALKHNKKTPDSALTLSFEETGEESVSYRTVLYKENIPLEEKTAESSPVEFACLAPNKNYWASVQVRYNNGEIGKEAHSNAVYTAPYRPEKFSAKPKVDDDVTLPVVELTWSAPEGCNVHKVNIVRATTPEATILVEGKNNFEYKCLDETCDYSFAVATANSSEIFSKPSEEFRVQFAPAKIAKVTATLNEATGILNVNWDKADNKAQSYIVRTITDGVGDVIQRQNTRETNFELKVDNQMYREYAFTVYPVDDAHRMAHGTKSNTVPINPPDVEMISVQPDPNSPTTSMIITWKKLLFNDIEYEVEIFPIDFDKKQEGDAILVRRETASCMYVCASPGSKYKVRVQPRLRGVPGRWSKPKVCQLAPVAVQDLETRLQKTPSGGKEIELIWLSAGNHVTKYDVQVYSHSLYEETGAIVYKRFKHEASFKKGERIKATVLSIPPGKFYRCEVTGIFGNFRGEPAISSRVFAGWEKPEYFSAELDKDDPSHKAIIKWNKPGAVDSFELVLSDSSGKAQTKCLVDTQYHLDSGQPGETYNLSLRWGFSGKFDCETLQETIRFAPGPPTEILLENIQDEKPGIKISIQCKAKKPDYFIVCVKEKATGRMITENRASKDENLKIEDGLRHGEKYLVSVQSVTIGLEKFPSKETLSNAIQIPPEKISHIEISEKNGMLIITWPELKTANRCIVDWAQEGEEYQRKTARGTKFEIRTQGYGETITARVAGENSGGIGMFSEEVVYVTVPSPPTDIHGKPSETEPETCLRVTYNDAAHHPKKKYVIYANDVKVGETKELQYTITGLTPGSSSMISVTSTVNDIESDHCRLTEPGVTAPGDIKQIDHERTEEHGLVFKWSQPNENQPNHYKLEFGYNDGQLQEHTSVDTKFRIFEPETQSTCKFRVSAVNSSGQGKWSKWETLQTAPGPPTEISVKNIKGGKPEIEISIQCQTKKPDYLIVRVKEKKTGKIATERQNLNDENIKIDDGLRHGEIYFVSVQSAMKGLEEFPSKETLSNVIQILPGEVKKIECERTEDHGVVFKWNQPNENQPKYYNLEFACDDGQPQEATSIETKFQILQLETQSTYKFRVAAVNGSGQGEWSKWETFQTAPWQPTKISVKNIQNEKSGIEISIQCKIKKPDYFIVRVKEKRTGKIVKELRRSNEENILIDDGLLHGEIYLVSVQSVTKGIEKFPSKETSSNAIQIPPEKISRIEISEENGMLIITWPELTKTNRYMVHWAQENEEYQKMPIRGTKLEKPTKGHGETISVRVAGENSGGIGMFSEEVVHVTVPSPPTDIHGKPSETEPETCIRVTYNDAAHHPKKKYVIYANDVKVGETNELQYTITALTPGSSSMISVTSIIDDRESEHCRLMEPGVTAPGEVNGMVCEKTEDQGMVFRWNHPDGNQPKYYKLECARNDGQPQEDTSVDTEFQILQPEKQSTYKLRVAAVNSSGQGIWSKWAKLWTGPPSPRNITAEIKIDEDGHKYMTIRIDDDRNPAKNYFICLMDERRRRKLYRTRDLLLRIDDFGDLADSSQLSVEVYSKMGKVRSETAYATPI